MLVAILLAARVLAAHFVSFYQNDEVSLAASAAALIRGVDGGVYHYGPQVGYYRLVWALDVAFGRDLHAVPLIMIWLSVLGGTLLPVCGWFLFPDQLSATERTVLAGVLAVNPIVWMSSTYGNTALPSAAVFALGITLLSRRPGRWLEAAALALCGAGILLRADAVLASPLIAVALYLRHRRIGAVAVRSAALAVAMAAIYGLLYLADPRMASSVHDVTGHLSNPRFPTMFWDYLLWGTSPFLLLFAALGLRELVAGRRALLALVTAWALPFFAFYFTATTQPRYFVPTAVPVALCTAVGIVALVPLLAPLGRRVAAGIVAVAATVHLFVGLGGFTPGSVRHLLTQASFPTQIGPMWTGAILYQSYFVPSLFRLSVRQPGFGRLGGTERVLDDGLAAIAGGAERGRTVVVVLAGWKGNAYHFYAYLHGADLTAREPGHPFLTETWMALGGARLMSIGRGTAAFRALDSLPVAPGDELWLMGYVTADDSLVADRLPPGVVPLAVGDTTAPVRRYRLAPVRRLP